MLFFSWGGLFFVKVQIMVGIAFEKSSCRRAIIHNTDMRLCHMDSLQRRETLASSGTRRDTPASASRS